MASVDWSRVLDLELAVRNLGYESTGDWHRDPWGWPEYNFLLKDPNFLIEHCRARGVEPVSLVNVPKENWGTRPAVVLGILDKLVYQALVDRVSIDLIGDLSPNVFGWRLPAVDPKLGRYGQNRYQWQAYTSHMKLMGSVFEVALKTDIVSFFASIPIDQVVDNIEERTPKNAVTARLSDLLVGFDKHPIRSGLPQRSSASSVIANMYLAAIDEVLSDHAERIPGLRMSKLKYLSFARWMDDIWLFGQEPASARQAQVELQEEAHGIGLHLNAAKTEVLEGEAVAAEALQIEHSAV